MAQPHVTYTILDNSNETSSVRFYLPELSGANFDANVDDTTGAVGLIRLAMNSLIEGNHLRRTVTAAVYEDGATIPASGWAQREIKAQFTFRDTVTAETGTFEIPTFDAGTYAESGTDVLDLEEVGIAAFVAAVEANAVSRQGNAIEIVTGRIVGRNI